MCHTNLSVAPSPPPASARAWRASLDLATRLNVSQQTVSRWEAGTHRPRGSQLPAIAAALRLDVSGLRCLAGYDGIPVETFAQPFPVDRLDPDSFEQFIADLAGHMFPGAVVRRMGKSGHRQDGIDVLAVLPDGCRIGLQCNAWPASAQAR